MREYPSLPTAKVNVALTLIRQFFPKKVQFNTFTQKGIAFAMNRLNHRCGKCPGFKTLMKQLHSRHGPVALQV